MLDLRRLEILHRFAVRGTITATASDLGYSPSAISQQLATLEREAGVALIERTAQRASLTDAGRELAEHAVRILAATEFAQARMRTRAGTIGGRVDISCIPALAHLLAPHLAALQREHPELRIVAHETTSTTAATAVLDRAYDLAVIDDWSGRRSPGETSGLAVHHLRQEEILLALPENHPDASQSGPVRNSQLRQTVQEQTWLCAPPGQLSRSAGDRRLTSAGAVPTRRWQFQGLHVIAALVGTGAGVALLPTSLAFNQPGVRALRLAPLMHRDILALTRTTARHDPAISSCLHAARDALRGGEHGAPPTGAPPVAP